MRSIWRYLILPVLFFTNLSLYAGVSPRNDAGSFKQHRISFAIGIDSLYIFAYDFATAFGHLFSTTENESCTYFGPFSFTYDRFISKHVSLGVVFAYARHTIEWTDTYGETDRDSIDLFAIAPKLLFAWGGDVLSVYHGISLGGGLFILKTEGSSGESTSETIFVPAVHLFLVGFNVKLGDTASFFVDVGGGYLGTLNFGVGFYL